MQRDLKSAVADWLARLEERHLADLRFAEVTRALRALSSTYVERRERLAAKSAFDSAGKRAAYALYYSPLHFLTVQHVLQHVEPGGPVSHLVDLGCGAGAAGAAWATSQERRPRVTGVDSHPWALTEAAFTYRCFAIDASTRRAQAAHVTLPRSADAIAVGWVLNELDAASRATLQQTLLDAVRAGRMLLVVEPIATRVSPWWNEWAAPFVSAGARPDEWRFKADLPDVVQRLGHAAGLRTEWITAKSIYWGR
jgi:hypothetical protein